jgi:flagellin
MFGDLTRVGANFHAMEAWSNLKKVNGDIGQIQSRLSSGKRINSAEDDTSGYALSKHLESRTRGLSQALDNVGTAKNVLNIAEGGYQSQMSILQTIKEKMTQAADGSFSDAQRGAIGDQVEALLKEFDDISSDTKFNDNDLFTGSATTFQVGEGSLDRLDVVFSTSTRNAVGEDNRNVDFDYNGNDASSPVSVVSGITDLDSGTVAVTVKDSDGDAVDSTKYTVDDATGNVTFDVDTALTAGTYNIEYTYTSSNATANVTESSVELRSDLSSLTQAQAQSGIEKLDLAIKSLAKSIQSVGDYNARLSSKEESLSLAISNTEATRSRIEDADFAKEQMSMMKLQILQQTSVSSFSQANSAPQVVMSLFR